jgi:hypothetical protein
VYFLTWSVDGHGTHVYKDDPLLFQPLEYPSLDQDSVCFKWQSA